MTERPSPSPPADAPDDLAAVWPLVLRWGVGDDVDRERLLEAATADELQELSRTVRPLLAAIGRYLDRTCDAERAVPFGDLAQAAIEAEQALARRAR